MQHQRGHLAGADAEDGFVVVMLENPAGAFDGDGADADAAFGDLRLRHHLLADGDGALEEGIERRADGAGRAGEVVGFADLAEDLRFADDHGIDRAGDGEDVLDGIALRFGVEMRTQFVDADIAPGGEEGDHVLFPRAAVDGAGGVELDAVAR